MVAVAVMTTHTLTWVCRAVCFGPLAISVPTRLKATVNILLGGETQTKDLYNWSTYKHANGTFLAVTKYCNDPNYGDQGYTDDLVTLQPEDDAAVVNWGNGWRMPTKDDWQELYDNTTEAWVTQNGVNGCLLTASNGNTLFLPAAGYYLTNTNLAAAGR